MMNSNQKISPYLWFDKEAEEAANFYTAVFPDSKMGTITRQGEAAFMVEFFLSGQKFSALNGGPMFTFSPSVSFYVIFESEAEIDEAWRMLSKGGKAMMPLNKYDWSEKYGWVQDKYGVSWQLTLGKIADVGQKISPLLMFSDEQHGRAEEAIHFYTSIFDNSNINLVARYEEGDEDPAIGTIKHSQINLDGNILMLMESSYEHGFAFNEAISFVINCGPQSEVDHFWEKLTSDGGKEMMCAWLKDKFGVVWQVVPEDLMKLIFDQDPDRAQRASAAMMKMRKIDIDTLHKAANGEIPTLLTVQAVVDVPLDKVWQMWTQPEHIVNWNFATPEWQCPTATNELTAGGKFSSRMEAKDGSMGFDFGGTHQEVVAMKSIKSVMDDGRTLEVSFSETNEGILVVEHFEAENGNPVGMQQQGWQAILNNFKAYAEAKG